jgi:hypothetical protein
VYKRQSKDSSWTLPLPTWPAAAGLTERVWEQVKLSLR